MDVFAVVKRSPIVFPLACAVALAMVLINEGAYRQSVAALHELRSSGESRAGLRALQQGLLTAQAGQRAYMLSGQAEHLQRYRLALRDMDGLFGTLERHFAGRPHAQAVLVKLRAAIAAECTEMAAAIERRSGGPGAGVADDPPADVERQQMDNIRALGAELLEIEAATALASEVELDRTLQLGRLGVAVLSAISLLALFLYLRQTHALDEQRRLQQRLVHEERDHLEAEVVHRTAQLTELTRHLLSAREDERNRLARDLHDELGALLTSAKLDAARMRSRLVGAAPAVLERLTHLVATLDSVIALKRRITEDLRPSTLSHLGLVATLEILAREFAERSGLEVHCALAEVRLEASAQLVVYRLVQEAVTNITKYAKARQVWLELAERDGKVEVSVRDDGVGFDSAAPNTSAFGLVGMRYRVEAEGGSLRVDSAPGHGTCVRAVLPRAPDSVANAA